MKTNGKNPEGKHLYGSIEAAKRAGISLRQLYHWVDDLGVVRPKVWQYGQRRFRRFRDRDIQKLKEMKDYVEWGYTLPAAARLIKGNREKR